MKSLKTFEEIYAFYRQISGNNNGIISSPIYQPVISDEMKFHVMSAIFPKYENLLNCGKRVSYHLAGYGITRQETLIRLIGEAIERYSLIYCHEYLKNKIFRGSYNNLKKIGYNVMDLKFLNVFNETKEINHVLNDDIIGWFKLIDVINNEPIFIPAQIFFLTYSPVNKMNEKINITSVSTGTAAHTSYENAFKNSLIEYLQTDSLMLFWYGKNVHAPEVVLDTETKNFLKKNKLLPENHKILILDLTFDKPFPIFLVIIHGEEYPKFSFGIQGSHSPHQALYRGLLESASVMNYLDGAFFNNTEDFIRARDKKQVFDNLDSNSIFWANESQISAKNNFLKSKMRGKINISDIKTVDETNFITKILDYIKINNFNLGCYDITCPEIGLRREWYVTRTIIPELLPMCIPNSCFYNHPRFLKVGGCEYILPHPLP
jgi:thiazole/oxazole-forming peptide maturase SagD family component